MYRRLASLQEYVLISSETQNVKIFRRNYSAEWSFIPSTEGEIYLASLALSLDIDAIYDDVTWETSSTEA